jgi:hypothetical protein
MDKNLNALFVQEFFDYWQQRHPDLPELMKVAFEEAKLKENADLDFEKWLQEIRTRQTKPL